MSFFAVEPPRWRLAFTDDGYSLISAHTFTHRLEVFIPGGAIDGPSSPLPSSVSRACFHACRGSLFALATAEKRCDMFAVSCSPDAAASGAEPSGTRFAIWPPPSKSGTRELVLSIDPEMYQRLGLEGQRSLLSAGGGRMDEDSNRRVVRIDIGAQSWVPGKPLFDRFRWCFADERVSPATFLVCSEDGSEDVLPQGIKAKRLGLRTSKTVLDGIVMPTAGAVAAIDRATKEDPSPAKALFDWAGLAAVRSENFDDLIGQIETFRGACNSIVIEGLMSPRIVREVVDSVAAFVKSREQPWAAVVAAGLRDSPISWAGSEHSAFLGGDNDLVAFVVPGKAAPAAICVVSPHDTFTGP